MAVRSFLVKMKESLVLLLLAIGAYALFTVGLVFASESNEATYSDKINTRSVHRLQSQSHGNLVKIAKLRSPAGTSSSSAEELRVWEHGNSHFVFGIQKNSQSTNGFLSLIRANDGTNSKPGLPDGGKIFQRF